MNQTTTFENRNLTALAEGMRFRIEVFTRSLMRGDPLFAPTKAEANRRRKELKEAGYAASLFQITDTGGLTPVG